MVHVESRPRVPWNPEPLEVQVARYPQAVKRVVDQLSVLRGAVAAPSAFPEQVFDSVDGLRLIVSLERTPEGTVITHVSASFHTRPAQERTRTLEELLAWIGDRWRAIAGATDTLNFLGVSEGGIPHFFVERSH